MDTSGTLHIDSFELANKQIMRNVAVAYRLTGEDFSPVVVVLGGISANRDVTRSDERGRDGWWPGTCGAGLAIDTDRRRILSFDYLGGAGETTGPRGDGAFPEITTLDQARLLEILLDYLRIPRVREAIGASYGGMVALAFAQECPERLERLTVINAAHKSLPMSIALRAIQRQIVTDAVAAGNGARGLVLARTLAMTTYRTEGEFRRRFDGPRTDADDSDSFPVWNYLRSRGDDFARWMNPESYLALTRSIDLHAVDPRRISVPLRVVCVHQDTLVPPSICEELARLAGGVSETHYIDSIYGHDAFLTAPAEIARALAPKSKHATTYVGRARASDAFVGERRAQ